MDNFEKYLAKKIIEVRKRNKLTQSELAKRIGTSKQAVANIELGRTSCKVSYLYKIALAFNVSADYLLGLKNEDEITISTNLNQKDTVKVREYIQLLESNAERTKAQ